MPRSGAASLWVGAAQMTQLFPSSLPHLPLTPTTSSSFARRHHARGAIMPEIDKLVVRFNEFESI
jgi:hypothetical protein